MCCCPQERAREEGRLFVAPYDDPYTIAGQGTIGLEILQQCAALKKKPAAIFVAIGGGGLISGMLKAPAGVHGAPAHAAQSIQATPVCVLRTKAGLHKSGAKVCCLKTGIADHVLFYSYQCAMPL